MKLKHRVVALATALAIVGGVMGSPKMESKAVSTAGVTVSTGYTRAQFLDKVNSQVGNDFYTFARNSGTSGYGNYYWCAAFVSYSLGKSVTGIPNYNRSVTSIAQAYKNAGRWHDVNSGYIPKPGDLVVYEENGDESDYEHIGVVVESDPKTGDITTVEGNAYRWRVHKNGFGSNERMKMDKLVAYDATFDSSISSTGNSVDFNKYLQRQGNGNYTGWVAPNWDYYFDSGKPCNKPQNRRVTRFEPKDVKYTFIAGYCSPQFKDEKTINMIRTRKLENSDVVGDVNDDGVINTWDLIDLNRVIVLINTDSSIKDTLSRSYGYSLYDVNKDGRVNESDYNALKRIFY